MSDIKDIRDAFFDELIDAATDNDRIVLVSLDQGAHGLEAFKRKFPDRYINMGPSEQAGVSVAAGLAIGGYYPVVYGIAAFLLGRAYEQVRVDIAGMYLPVVLAGCGGGYAYGSDGMTHHFPEEYHLLMENSEIVSYFPPDDISMSAVVRHVSNNLNSDSGPKYISIKKGTHGRYYDGADDDLIIRILARCGILHRSVVNGDEQYIRENLRRSYEGIGVPVL